jgi:hypothetical protein
MNTAKRILFLLKEALIARGDSEYVKETEESVVKSQNEIESKNNNMGTVKGCYQRILDEFEMRILAFKNGFIEEFPILEFGMIPEIIVIGVLVLV